MTFINERYASVFLILYVLSFYCYLGEVKTLMIQLLRGVNHMHDNWILHRDIKASNLLLSHKGILKVIQFEFSFPVLCILV